MKHVIMATAESTTFTVVDLDQEHATFLCNVFDAINESALVEDNYAATMFLFAGTKAEVLDPRWEDRPRDGLKPLNIDFWEWLEAAMDELRVQYVMGPKARVEDVSALLDKIAGGGEEIERQREIQGQPGHTDVCDRRS